MFKASLTTSTKTLFFCRDYNQLLFYRNTLPACYDNIKNVKFSRYRPGVAQRVGRGIALLFHDRVTRRWSVVSSTLRPYRERHGTHFTEGWVSPRAGLDGRKFSSPPGFNHGPSSPVVQSLVAITTELPDPHANISK